MTTTPEDLGLFTDLYELTMAEAYFREGMFAPATFSLFIREYPPNRSYFVAAGLEDVLTYLENWRLSREDIDYLQSTCSFSTELLDYLSELRFSGEVWAIPEGGLFFADEPVMEVTAPIIEAQIVETYIINQINLQSLIATKAARCVWAARGKPLADFSLRRTHGTDAGMKVARASYIAGFQSTSNVLAGKRYGIPISGTMAHSFVTSFPDEMDAFRAYTRSYDDSTVLLIDTYDTLAGARKAVVVGKELERQGGWVQGVRLDSGDYGRLSREVRRILDEAHLNYVTIVASGGLDEFQLDELTRGGAPIDAFGVGTRLGVSDDAPWTDMAYKLVSYDGRPVLKLSEGKTSLPGAKQVFRMRGEKGSFDQDIIASRDERVPEGEPLLVKVMEGGKRLDSPASLGEIWAGLADEFTHLDDRLKVLRDPPTYHVTPSPGLKALYHRMEQELRAGKNGQAGGHGQRERTT